MLTCKQKALIAVEVLIQQYQTLFEHFGDPVFKLALNESILEYGFVQAIPDNDKFTVIYTTILIRSGLKKAIKERLDRIADIFEKNECQ